LGDRRDTQAIEVILRWLSVPSVTEVIEVIGYQLPHGVLWPYLAGCLGKYQSFNPENLEV
jgi:hypothetical protein